MKASCSGGRSTLWISRLGDRWQVRVDAGLGTGCTAQVLRGTNEVHRSRRFVVPVAWAPHRRLCLLHSPAHARCTPCGAMVHGASCPSLL